MAPVPGSVSGTLIVGPSETFKTIQEAVTAAAAGATILVKTGVYQEQVTIEDKAGLTIKPFNAAAVVTIKAPAELQVNGTAPSAGSDLQAVRSVVSVNNSSNVRIEKIIIDGAFSGDDEGAGDIAGLAYLNSSGRVLGVTIDNVASPQGGAFGLQRGHGLLIDGGPEKPDLLVEVRDTKIGDFQQTGAFVTGVKLTFANNTIEGAGATGGIVQNGLRITNVEGSVTGNKILNFGYLGAPGDDSYAAGILGFEPSGTLTISGNTVRGAAAAGRGSAGIDFADTAGQSVRIQNNILDDLGYGLVNYGLRAPGLDRAAVVSGNQFSDIAVNGILLDAERGGPATVTTQRYEYVGSLFADVLRGSNGIDNFDGGAGNDELAGRGGDDRLLGGAGNDLIDGGDGADTIEGGDGDDALTGGAGNDRILGNNGLDLFRDGGGDDRYTGGAGRDSFLFSGQNAPVGGVSFGNDLIMDFNVGNVLDFLSIEGVTRRGFAVTTLDTNGDNLVNAADGDNFAGGDFAVVRAGSLILQFDQGSVTLNGKTQIAASQAQIVSGTSAQQSVGGPDMGVQKAGFVSFESAFLV